MKLRAVLSYASPFLVALAGVYVLLRVAPGHRTETFVMLSMTAVGAIELALATASAGQRESRSAIIAHALTGVGGLAIGYSLLDRRHPAFFTVGGLLFATGMYVRYRTRTRATSA